MSRILNPESSRARFSDRKTVCGAHPTGSRRIRVGLISCAFLGGHGGCWIVCLESRVYAVKGGPGLESVVGISERIPVTAEPIVADNLQSPDQFFPVGSQTTTQEKIGLLLVCERGLAILHRFSLENEKPATFEHARWQRLGGSAKNTIASRYRKVNIKLHQSWNFSQFLSTY